MTDHEPARIYPAPAPPALSRWLVAFILMAIMAFGLFVRTEDYPDWLAAREVTFFDEKPLLGALDGYYYLRLARDLLENTYAPHDPLRNAPDGFNRPTPPPLLSCMAAGICRATGWQLDWVGFFLPAFLGTLLALPLFGFGHKLGGPIAGLTAALAGVLAPYVVYRGGMGWFDTDCLNATFALSIAYCFMRFSTSPTLRRFGWLLAGLLCTGLFLWWWDQAPSAVLILSFCPLLLSLFLSYRPQHRKEFLLLAVPLLLMLLFMVLYFSGLRQHLENWLTLAHSQIQHITKQNRSHLPNFAITISEQNPPPFSYVVDATTVSLWAFLLSLSGFLLIACRRTKIALFLFPTVILSLLSVTYAERFLIFLTPLLALGLGYLTGGLWRLAWLHNGLTVAATVLGLLAVYPSGKQLLSGATAWPKTDALRVSGMVEIANQTPTNALVWTSWDNGYAIQYFARRATIADGQIHGTELTQYATIPFTTTNPALSSRLILFYAAYGASGMRQHSAANLFDPDSYQQPSSGSPVYLYLDYMSMTTAPLWYPFGLTGSNAPVTVYQPIFNLTLTPSGVYDGHELVIDTENGFLNNGGTQYYLSHFMARESSGAWIKAYPTHTKGGCFELLGPRGFGVLMNPEVTESVFNRLFVRTDITLSQWFEPLSNQSPNYQIWKVLPQEPAL